VIFNLERSIIHQNKVEDRKLLAYFLATEEEFEPIFT